MKKIELVSLVQAGFNVLAMVLAVGGGVALAASEVRGDGEGSGRPLRIVTTILPLQAHTLAITGGLAEVEQLLSRDTGPHDFQLTPSDVRRIAQADMLIINGGGLESWLDDLIRQAGNPNLVVVDTSLGIEAVESPPEMELGEAGLRGSGNDEHHHGAGHHHEHGECHVCGEEGRNPHFWLDPVLALQQARTILAALEKADPKNASTYQSNARSYFEELQKLDTEFRETLARLPNKKLVTFHNAFPYLAQRYGLEYVGYVEQFPEKDPSPQQLAALVRLIRKHSIGVLFAEQNYSTHLLERLARESGAVVSTLDTLEVGLGEQQSYIERMRGNLETLRRAFAEGAVSG